MSNRTNILLSFWILLFFGTNTVLLSQISDGGAPLSFAPSFAQQTSTDLPITFIPSIDIAQFIKEDEISGRNFRFAAPIDVDFSLENAGTWTTLDNGDRIWQLKIHSPNALGLAVLYNDFYMPRGAKLFMYSADRAEVLGAYTQQNNKASRKFLTGIVHTDTAVIEYYEPQQVRGQGVVQIHRIMHAYDRAKITPPNDNRPKIYGGGGGFGMSLDCHVNVNCTEGEDWQKEKRSVVRIMVVVAEGMGWCSGSLLNNTNNDGTPYILSAYHCQDGYTPQYDFYRFDFNYEATSCSNPSMEPQTQSIVGCFNRAGRQQTDFKLFELSSNIPLSYLPYYCGWNRNNTYLAASTANIHHPNGDIKKISLDSDPTVVYNTAINWNNNVITPANHHFEVNYESGTFEGGSSGSPLFDNFGRVIGQLHGGNADCSIFEAFFGRLALSWDAGGSANTQLKDWLDSSNTGLEFVDAYDPSTVIPTATISGQIMTDDSEPIWNTKVYLYNSSPYNETPPLPIDSVTVGDDGRYEFTHVLQGINYFVLPQKDILPENGVSTYDIILIQQYILGFSGFDSPYKYLAADVNQTGDISTFDIVQMRQVILNFIDTFPNAQSWRFARSTFFFADPHNPFATIGNDNIDVFPVPNLSSDKMDVNFIGYKVGDVNDNADARF